MVVNHRRNYYLLSGVSTQHARIQSYLSTCSELGMRKQLEKLGYELKEDEVESIFWQFKAMADKKKRVSDADLKALVSNEAFCTKPIWKLRDLQVICGTMGLSTATIKLASIDGIVHVACSIGTGPVDSAYKAVNLIVKEPVKLLEYSLSTVTESIDATVTTRVVICKENNHASTDAFSGDTIYPTFSGTGAGMDVVVSSVEAYLTALNKMLGSDELFISAERNTISE